MDNELFSPEEMQSPFDAIKETDAEGREWWNSRKLARLLGYLKYWNFERLMDKVATFLQQEKGLDLKEHMVEIELIEKYQCEEHQGLRQELAEDGNHDIPVGLGNPLLATAEFQFHAEGIGGDEEHKEHHHTRHEDGGEVEVVVGPGIGNLVQVNADGLQEGLYLFGGIALGPHRGLSHGSRTEVGNGLQVLHQQCTRHDGGEVVIIGNLGATRGE